MYMCVHMLYIHTHTFLHFFINLNNCCNVTCSLARRPFLRIATTIISLGLAFVSRAKNAGVIRKTLLLNVQRQNFLQILL